METVCQACGYQRKPTDQTPDWQCPSCGKAYAKVAHDSPGSVLRYAPAYPREPANALVKAVPYKESPDGLTVIICMGGACLIAIAGMFLITESSAFKWPLTIVMLLMPWIAVVLAYARRDALLEDLGSYASFILGLSLCFLMFGVVRVAVNVSLAFDAETLWLRGAPVAFVFGLVCAAVAMRLSKQKEQKCPIVVWPLLVATAYAYGGTPVVLANRWFDHSSPTVHETTVTGKYVSQGIRNGGHYVVMLAPWATVANSNFIIVSRDDYHAMVPGQTVVCMGAHPGAIGAIWGGRVPCDLQSAGVR
jgi:hypothetical protein